MITENRNMMGLLLKGGLALALAGLAGCAVGSEDINVAPASLDEAEESLRQIDEILEADPQDADAREALRMLQPRLDALNNLVARVAINDTHTVSFYEVAPGVIGVAESAPAGEPRLLTDDDVIDVPVVEIYEGLTGTPAPEALVLAQAREDAQAALEPDASLTTIEPEVGTLPADTLPANAFGMGVAQQALTGGHGQYFRDNYCFTGGEFRGCYPNHHSNRFAQASTKTSFFTVAPYVGTISVRFKYSGTTRFTTPVYSGEVRSYWWRSSSHDPSWPPFSPRRYNNRTHRWEIIHASNNHFHWTHAFRWNCGYADCDGWPR